MTYHIREATETDFPAILAMIRELAAFEKAPEKVTNSLEQMQQEKDFFRCLVAEGDDGHIAGMALYFIAYYTWVGKSLFLDDLYVREASRQQKVGSALLKKLFEVALKEDCKRVRWQVLNWNHPAIGMYRKLGAAMDDEWLTCTVEAGHFPAFEG